MYPHGLYFCNLFFWLYMAVIYNNYWTSSFQCTIYATEYIPTHLVPLLYNNILRFPCLLSQLPSMPVLQLLLLCWQFWFINCCLQVVVTPALYFTGTWEWCGDEMRRRRRSNRLTALSTHQSCHNHTLTVSQDKTLQDTSLQTTTRETNRT